MTDRFLEQLQRENAITQASANAAREEGDHALAERIELEESERTITALQAHGYAI